MSVPYLDETAWEGGTFPIRVSFFEPDEAGVDVAVLPNTVTWSLFEVVNDTTASIVNGRSDETITPGEEITIILTGDDLVTTSKSIFQLEVKAIYDSVLYGLGVPLVQAVRFRVVRLYGE